MLQMLRPSLEEVALEAFARTRVGLASVVLVPHPLGRSCGRYVDSCRIALRSKRIPGRGMRDVIAQVLQGEADSRVRFLDSTLPLSRWCGCARASGVPPAGGEEGGVQVWRNSVEI